MTPPRYHRSQIILHWLVALLVLAQLMFGMRMERVFLNALDLGREVIGETPPWGIALAHGLTGTLILILMLTRLYLRLTRDIPPPPPKSSKWVQILSRANHWAFYVVLIAMPPVGLYAWFAESLVAGTIHSWAADVLLALALLHLSGVVYHVFLRKGEDGVLRRMAPADPERSRF